MNAQEYYAKEPTGSQAYGAPRPNGRTHTGDDYSHSTHPDTVRVPYARAGRVTAIQRDRPGLTNGYGNQVTVDHGDGTSFSYSHLGRITATVGQHVTTADSPGTEGSTGWTSGSCMHLEYWQNGRRSDPSPHITTGLPAGGTSHPITPPSAETEDDDMTKIYSYGGNYLIIGPETFLELGDALTKQTGVDGTETLALYRKLGATEVRLDNKRDYDVLRINTRASR